MSTNESSRCVLEGVPPVAFYPQIRVLDKVERCPEDIPYPSCLRAALEYMGDPVGCEHLAFDTPCRTQCGYAHLVGVCGAAFKLNWAPGWQGDNVEIMYMSDDPWAPFERSARHIGWQMRYFDRRTDDEASFRTAIVSSIRGLGRPLIAFGPIGPPEASLVCGYDEGGDVLIGWSYFQRDFGNVPPVDTEPNGMYRLRDWYAGTQALAVFQGQVARPALRETYIDSLRFGLEVMRSAITWGNKANGIAAFDAWMADLLDDAIFGAADAALQWRLYDAHNNNVGWLAEARWYGSLFLREAAVAAPELIGLEEAADCFKHEHDLMWDVWGAVGGNGRDQDKVAMLMQPRVRRQVVALLEQSREWDVRAARLIAGALARVA